MGGFVVLRPSIAASTTTEAANFRPPSLEELQGQWFIIQSSLPYWRDKRNIKISYNPSSADCPAKRSIEDVVAYKCTNSERIKTVHGVNTPSQGGQPGFWDWRGCGWVKVVSNRWEVLGHNPLGNLSAPQWIVIHTGKSFFAPAAIHVYSRSNKAMAADVAECLKAALTERPDLWLMAQNMFEIQHE